MLIWKLDVLKEELNAKRVIRPRKPIALSVSSNGRKEESVRKRTSKLVNAKLVSVKDENKRRKRGVVRKSGPDVPLEKHALYRKKPRQTQKRNAAGKSAGDFVLSLRLSKGSIVIFRKMNVAGPTMRKKKKEERGSP